MKLVLIGAGSAQFGFGTLGDIFSSAFLKGSHIALVDINEAEPPGRPGTHRAPSRRCPPHRW